MNFELFAFDLDGTLLGPDGVLPPATRDFLGRLRARARMTLATGRSLPSAWPYIEDLGIREPVVLYHGAVVFCPNTRKTLYEAHLSPDVVRSALQIASDFPVDVQLYRSVDDPRIYVRSLSPNILQFAKKEGLSVQVVDELEALAKEGLLKLLFIGMDSVFEELREALKGVEATVTRSERNYLEILPPGVSKGAGLAWLCERLNIPLEKVVAVGDQESDISMFEVVGMGVAMAHAPCTVLEQADWVIRNIPELHVFL